MYVDVILPIAVPELFSYVVNNEQLFDTISIGSIVAVGIGKSKVSGAIVVAKHLDTCNRELKPVLDIIDSDPIVTPIQLKFWWWLSSYYMCNMGEIYNHFLPSTLKPTTTNNANGYEFSKTYGYKEEQYLYLNPIYASSEAQSALLDSYKRSKAKLKLITIFLEQIATTNNFGSISKTEIQNLGITIPTINNLIKEKVIMSEVRKVKVSHPAITYNQLYTQINNDTVTNISQSLIKHQTTLLKTSNTESINQACFGLINDVMKNGGEVLILHPSLFSAAETDSKFAELFGDNFIQYDKKKSKNAQHSTYTRILENQGALLVSTTRVGIGLPFKNLQLVIVNHEHDTAYQGYEYDPSYNGKDAAIYLAHLHEAKTLLISSAPTIESYHNCMIGKFALVEERNNFYPKINIIERSSIARSDYKLYDSSSERRFISQLLIKEIENRISRGECTFLYQNRKGFATVIECTECGEYVHCTNCNATLTYHKSTNDLRCRYCSTRYDVAQKCTSCCSTNLRLQGIGTENVEQKVIELFPSARVARLDTDIIEKPLEFQTTLSKIYAGEIDIIVGTQLVTKIQEIKNLSLIGVINGDNMFAFADYRSAERAYQTLSTLAMKLPQSTNSLMVLQMSHTTGITKFLYQDNYHALYEKEINERKIFSYPPFCKLITFTLKHSDLEKLTTTANLLHTALTSLFSKRVSGVITPQIDRIRREYIRQIVIKIENGANLQKAKDLCCQSAKQYAKKVRTSITTI